MLYLFEHTQTKGTGMALLLEKPEGTANALFAASQKQAIQHWNQMRNFN